jgi:hypothetical protein
LGLLVTVAILPEPLGFDLTLVKAGLRKHPIVARGLSNSTYCAVLAIRYTVSRHSPDRTGLPSVI